MEDAGVKTAGVVSILGSDTDFTAPATQAMGTNPDMIMVWTTQTPAVASSRPCATAATRVRSRRTT